MRTLPHSNSVTFISLTNRCTHAIDTPIWWKWPISQSLISWYLYRSFTTFYHRKRSWSTLPFRLRRHTGPKGLGSHAPAVVILGELHRYHVRFVRWTDRSRMPKWIRYFGPWSVVTSIFLYIRSNQKSKWPRTEVDIILFETPRDTLPDWFRGLSTI